MTLFPVFVLEKRTEVVFLLENMGSLRAHVRQFWDVLGENYKMWSAEGKVLSFESAFLENADRGINISEENEFARLRDAVTHYGRKYHGQAPKGASVASLVATIKSAEEMEKPGCHNIFYPVGSAVILGLGLIYFIWLLYAG